MFKQDNKKKKKKSQVYQFRLTYIETIFHNKIADYKPFSSAHEPFHRVDYMFCNEINHAKFKTTEIILRIFSNESDMRLKINIGSLKMVEG